MASLPDSYADEEDLLTQHFCFTPEGARRIIDAVKKMGDHTTLLDEVSVLLDNARFLQANHCSSAPFTWTLVGKVTPEVHHKTRDDLCVFNVPTTATGFEDRLERLYLILNTFSIHCISYCLLFAEIETYILGSRSFSIV